MIAVLGSTGTIGMHLARHLADDRIDHRLVLRSPAAARQHGHAIFGDLRARESLVDAMVGADRLFLLTPHGPDQDLLEAAAISAAVEAGIRGIVKLSATASSLGEGGATSTAIAHARSEALIEASGLDFCHLRPSFLMQNLLDTAAPTARSLGILPSAVGTAAIAMTDARDVAAAAYAVLLRPVLGDEAITLTGPAAITHQHIAGLLGLRTLRLPPRLTAHVLHKRGESDWAIDHALRMADFLKSGADATTDPALGELLAQRPRTVESFLVDHAEHFGRRTPTGSNSSRRLVRAFAVPRGI